MKKNMMMRLASVLLVATLLSTCAISGTFAKYTTSVSADDSARVAMWGFDTAATVDFENLFAKQYTNVKDGDDTTAIIAPGTNGHAAFIFETIDAAKKPEVTYTFAVDTSACAIAEAIKNNANIKWGVADTATLDTNGYAADSEYGTWDAMIAEIKALSGDASGSKQYAVGELPAMVDKSYSIVWKWDYEGGAAGDATDTALGNAAIAGDLVVTVAITISATQVD